MKRWTLLGAVGCLALLAAVIMTGVGRMAPPAAADSGIFSIWGYVWDDTDVDGVRDGGEVGPTRTWNCISAPAMTPGDAAKTGELRTHLSM